ncbi:hypothetical protein GCM10011579_076960 [Streptomyces albiflavescens]|uniref:Uncharacterized protein n=1 Tax=Streptomyces albiflavescens TaxID=1623582 RepID=A0A917YCE4_9ACTN|nr:hypothetical protein GCM10011579_076960 [Streptomyces albiflavescens]
MGSSWGVQLRTALLHEVRAVRTEMFTSGARPGCYRWLGRRSYGARVWSSCGFGDGSEPGLCNLSGHTGRGPPRPQPPPASRAFKGYRHTLPTRDRRLGPETAHGLTYGNLTPG